MAVVAEGRLVVDDEPVALEVRGRADGLEEIGGRGRDVGHRSGGLLARRSVVPTMVRPRPATPPRPDRYGCTMDIDELIRTKRAAARSPTSPWRATT